MSKAILIFIALVAIDVTAIPFHKVPSYAPIHTLFRKTMYDHVKPGFEFQIGSNSYTLAQELEHLPQRLVKVYKAVGSTPVVVKFFKDTLMTKDQITREFKISQQMSRHQSSVAVLDTQRFEGTGILVLEHVEVHQDIPDKERAERELFNVVQDMRTFKIIHRALSWETVRISSTGRVKIIDYRHAVYDNDRPMSQTLPSDTPLAFRSPEMLYRRIYDRNTDLWSLGALALAIEQGKTVAVFKGKTEGDVMKRIAAFLGQRQKLHPDIANVLKFKSEDRFLTGERPKKEKSDIQREWQSLTKVHPEPLLVGFLRKHKVRFENAKVGDMVTLCQRNYKLLDRVGSGASGVVFKAENNFGKTVAIKVAMMTPYDEEALRNEVLVMKKMSPYTNSVKLYCSELQHDSLFFVMEFIQGGDLLNHMKTRFSSSELSYITNQLKSVLKRMRSLNIVHRDIKPENVLLTMEGELKLADYGTSVITKDKMSTDVGSSVYMAPEIESGEYDRNVDIWSAGATMYLISTHEIMEDINTVNENLLKYNVPQDVADFIRHALQLDPTQRDRALV